jgi:putative transposase
LENYYLPEQLKCRIGLFVNYYNTRIFHESLNNLILKDTYLERGQANFERAEENKNSTVDLKEDDCIFKTWSLKLKLAS